MGTFDAVELAPPDAIFGLSVAFKNDPRPEKVNLGVGVFRTADLTVPILSAVRQAEKILVEAGESKTYLPIDGDPDYVRAIGTLVFGKLEEKIFGAQSVGGTGALRTVGDFLKQVLGRDTIYLPHPTWANHAGIFRAAGLELHSYPYYNPNSHGLDLERLIEEFEKIPEGSAVLFHACCHNPTGVDPSFDQWKAIAQVVQKRNLLPIFDCAYQGFGDGLDEDADAVRHFTSLGINSFVCSSCSKNFGLYAERIGALFAITESKEQAERVGSQVRRLIRKNYSNPPCHGARIVRTILDSDTLRSEWQQEVDGMRSRLHEMRHALMAGLLAKGGERDYRFLQDQKGMFSFCGLSQGQAEQLTAEFAIHVPKNGRINVSGLNTQNLDYVVEAICAL
jgi:aspartate aminotransferase